MGSMVYNWSGTGGHGRSVSRLNHGYEGEADCYNMYTGDDYVKPKACFAGSADAQSAIALSNPISNGPTFITLSLIGSLSDEYGRTMLSMLFRRIASLISSGSTCTRGGS
jgi:hypothetical protein